MEREQLGSRSHLFMVRLWPEDVGAGQTEWRGRLQHVTSGEVAHFRDGSSLLRILRDMLPEGTGEAGVALSPPPDGDPSRPI
jgi:hypothetical protein